MGEAINSIMNGSFTLNSLWAYIEKFVESGGSDMIISFVTKILGTVGIYLLLAVGVLELLYGKKFLNLQKFIFCAVAGYFVGVVVVSPVINSIFPLSSTICGAVIALLAAVLSKMIYNIALYGGGGFLAYLFFFANGVLQVKLPTEGNLAASLIAAVAVVIVMIIARKNIDRVLTSFVGAVCITAAVKHFYDFTALVPGGESWIHLAALILISVIGFIFQYKRRRRYYG